MCVASELLLVECDNRLSGASLCLRIVCGLMVKGIGFARFGLGVFCGFMVVSECSNSACQALEVFA